MLQAKLQQGAILLILRDMCAMLSLLLAYSVTSSGGKTVLPSASHATNSG